MRRHVESKMNAVLNARLQTVAPEMKRIRMIVSFDDEPGRQAAADRIRGGDVGPGYNHTTPLRTLHESSARFGSGRDARPPRDERGSPPAQDLPFRSPPPPPQLPLGPLSVTVPAGRRHAPPVGSMTGTGLEPDASFLLHSPSASPCCVFARRSVSRIARHAFNARRPRHRAPPSAVPRAPRSPCLPASATTAARRTSPMPR